MHNSKTVSLRSKSALDALTYFRSYILRVHVAAIDSYPGNLTQRVSPRSSEGPTSVRTRLYYKHLHTTRGIDRISEFCKLPLVQLILLSRVFLLASVVVC